MFSGIDMKTYLIEKESEIHIETKMLIPPPPTPCSARERMSQSMVVARPHSRLPRKKTLIARSKSGFRPHMSLIFAHTGDVTAVASTYADPIHA